MSDDSYRSPANVWLRPVAVLAALILLALASLAAAYLPLGAFTMPVNLVVAATMVALLWLFLMNLIAADTLIRLIAVSGLLWLSFMFVLTFSDYLFRRCETQVGKQSAFCAVQNVDRGAF